VGPRGSEKGKAALQIFILQGGRKEEEGKLAVDDIGKKRRPSSDEVTRGGETEKVGSSKGMQGKHCVGGGYSTRAFKERRER